MARARSLTVAANGFLLDQKKIAMREGKHTIVLDKERFLSPLDVKFFFHSDEDCRIGDVSESKCKGFIEVELIRRDLVFQTEEETTVEESAAV